LEFRPSTDVDALVTRINSLYDAAFVLRGRARVGESGRAFILANATGEQFILKFGRGAETRPERAAQITKGLREVGFPAPVYVCVGSDGDLKYSVQAMMPGEPHQRLNAAMVRQLIAINRLQAGLADDLPPEWPSRVIDGVLKGFEGYCVIDTLRQHSGESAAMLQTLQELVVRNSAEIYLTRDIVHWDFNQGNVLCEGNRITGVVDWDGACAGDRGFDLSTYLFHAYGDREVRDPLWREVLDCSGHGALAVYLAHMIIRQVDWAIRHHDSASVARWMTTGKEILREL
jgi:aminoglycoside phosphotransferase (APT) family kinase protein